MVPRRHLAGAAAVTVFAPTNAAFANLPGANDVLNDPELLTNTLLYHALGSLVALDQLSNTSYTTLIDTLGDPTSFNPQLNVTVTSESAIIATPSNASTATLTGWDNTASNGVVHVINAVLVPESP